MRISVQFIGATAIALAFQVAPSHAATSCEAKRADIVRNIDEAKAKGQTRRLRGLEKALREVQENCSDAALRQEHADRIAKQERKVAERQRDLDKARAQGKANKITEREAKLARELAELEQLRSAGE